MKLQAIIWDLDGTLVDSEELHRSAFNKAFNEYGLDWYWDRKTYCGLLSKTGSKGKIHHYAKLSGLVGLFLPVSIEEIYTLKTRFFHEGIRDGELALRSGVENILNESVDSGIRLAIATTTTISNVEILFEAGVLICDQWDVVVAGNQVEKREPAPDVYLEALRKLELEPGECLAIEDSGNGSKAAIDAGLPTVVTTNTYTCHQEFGRKAILTHGFCDEVLVRSGTTIPITLRHFEAWHAVAETFVSVK